MNKVSAISTVSSIVCALMVSVILVACGGGSGSSTPAATTQSATTSTASSQLSLASSSAASSPAITRSLMDRPDKHIDQYQVHVIYAVPSDKQDQQRDINGVFARSLQAANQFFAKTTNQKIRFDELADGALDVSFLALPNNDNYYASKLAFAREAVQTDVRSAGFNNARKIYLVYYEGTNDSTCGNAPAVGSGDGVTVLYLQGLSNTTFACAGNLFSTDINSVSYWEFVPLHELVHTLSFVDSCAPHGKSQANHTSDNPADLMYAGNQPWNPTTVDPGQDDYYGPNVPTSCPRNLMYSAFLEPQLGSELPINFPHN